MSSNSRNHATPRDFLAAAGGSTLLAFSPGAPQFLLRASAAEKAKSGDNVLIVVQLSGGNDGLNTVAPYADDAYHRNRYTLGVKAEQVLKIDDYLGLHPAMRGFSDLLEQGQLGIVQGVGYPQPNRSHFESMDIWHTCYRKDQRRDTGWLGRYLDLRSAAGGDLAAMHLGAEPQPPALAARNVAAASVASLERFKLNAGRLRPTIEAVTNARRQSENDLLGFVQQSASAALVSSQRVEQALGRNKTSTTYPDTGLARKLKGVAGLIGAGLKTRVYYVTLGGFDTHSDQAQAHAALLGELSGAVKALFDDLKEQGNADRVLLTVFSEFGRRVKQNASAGTDHGAAAPMFVAGGKVRSGLIGKHPSLTDLDSGDLKHHTDFRQVYAAVLEGWLGCPSEKILGGKFEPAQILRG